MSTSPTFNLAAWRQLGYTERIRQAPTDPDPTTLLRMVAAMIEDFPEHHSQDTFVEERDGDSNGNWDPVNSPEELAGNVDLLGRCGTTCCIGGWAIALSTPEAVEAAGPGTWSETAGKLLGLPNDGAAEELFYWFPASHGEVSGALAMLAATPPEDRTYDHIRSLRGDR